LERLAKRTWVTFGDFPRFFRYKGLEVPQVTFLGVLLILRMVINLELGRGYLCYTKGLF